MKRVILDIVWRGGQWVFQARHGQKSKSGRALKSDAVFDARALCFSLLRCGQRSQIVVHGKDGKIQTEYTYIDDPRSRKG